MSTIQISENTKEELKKLAFTPGESYENIIIRLLEKQGVEKMETIRSFKIETSEFNIQLEMESMNDEIGEIRFYHENGEYNTQFPSMSFQDSETQSSWDNLSYNLNKVFAFEEGTTFVDWLCTLEPGQSHDFKSGDFGADIEFTLICE